MPIIMIPRPRRNKNKDNFIEVLVDGKKIKIPKGSELSFPVNTYGDFIRSLNDEELAEFLEWFFLSVAKENGIPVEASESFLQDILKEIKRNISD